MNMGASRVVELHATVQGRDAVILDVGNPQCAFPGRGFRFRLARSRARRSSAIRASRTAPMFRLSASVDRHTIDVRFWERGAGETNSSGTGSTGAAWRPSARGIVGESGNGT